MSAPRHILVPVTDDRASLAAVAVACDLARRERGTVEFVHVIEVPRSLEVDADVEGAARRGEVILRRAEDLAGTGCSVRGELLQARRASTALLDEARATEAGLIVLGIGARRDRTAFRLGETSETLLRDAPCEVWIIREGVQE